MDIESRVRSSNPMIERTIDSVSRTYKLLADFFHDKFPEGIPSYIDEQIFELSLGVDPKRAERFIGLYRKTSDVCYDADNLPFPDTVVRKLKIAHLVYRRLYPNDR